MTIVFGICDSQKATSWCPSASGLGADATRGRASAPILSPPSGRSSIRSSADVNGQPWAEWDRARMQALREEIGDEVIWQRFMTRMHADPARFYPPWAQPIG